MEQQFVVGDYFPTLSVREIRKSGSCDSERMKQAGAKGAARARQKFLSFFPRGFRDATYLEWERDHKVKTHQRWEESLHREEFGRLLKDGEHGEIVARAVRIEQCSRHSMIFSFEKMALRDAVRSAGGARAFAEGLYDFLHGRAE